VRIAIGIDTELAAPALAAEFTQGSGAWHQLLASPNATHTIRADRVDSETPQELLRSPKVRGVLWKEDDTRSKADFVSHQLPYPLSGSFEAPFLPRNLVVDDWIERVEREMDQDSQVFECLNEIFSEQRGVREDFATLETHARGVLDEPSEIWMERGLTTYELQPPTACRSCFTHHTAPIGKFHPLGEP
jgi:hypothetical protein